MNTAVRTDNASKADKRQPKIDANTRIISLHTWERNRENSHSLNDLTVKNQPELFISGSSGVNEGVLPCWLWLPIIDQHTTSATSSDAPVLSQDHWNPDFRQLEYMVTQSPTKYQAQNMAATDRNRLITILNINRQSSFAISEVTFEHRAQNTTTLSYL